MAGCVPCFVIPLLLFIFHRYIQPILLRFWNPWENKTIQENGSIKKEDCKFSCECAWMKKKPINGSSGEENEEKRLEENDDNNSPEMQGDKVKSH